MIVFSGLVHAITGLIIWFFFPTFNLVAVIIGSLFPDSDIRTSAMGRIIPLWIFFKHRGFTHTIWAVLILFAVLYDLLGENVAYSFAVGHISHIVLDVIAPKRKSRQ